MSRLDSFIRRLSAQRACLEQSFELIRELPGPIIELGLGNGRTFDHLRQHLPDRRIVVFERQPKAHPDCMPNAADLIVGSLDETLPGAQELIDEPVALLHSDIGCGIAEIDRANADLISRHLGEIMAYGGIVLSDQPLICEGFHALPLPDGVKSGRYTFLRRDNHQQINPKASAIAVGMERA